MDTKQGKHTATPWKISSSLIICDEKARVITSAVNADIDSELYIDYAERRANIELIVRAVNNHESLLDGLRFSISIIQDMGIDLPSGIEATKTKVETLKRILKKAEAPND